MTRGAGVTGVLMANKAHTEGGVVANVTAFGVRGCRSTTGGVAPVPVVAEGVPHQPVTVGTDGQGL